MCVVMANNLPPDVIRQFPFYKKLHACKPDSVSRFTPGLLSFLCDFVCTKPVTPNPSVIARAALKHGYTWTFNPQGLPCCHVTTATRRLLPHIFTLSASPAPPKERRRNRWLFSAALSVAALLRHPPVRWCGALCCPDFPSLIKLKNDRTACSLTCPKAGCVRK